MKLDRTTDKEEIPTSSPLVCPVGHGLQLALTIVEAYIRVPPHILSGMSLGNLEAAVLGSVLKLNRASARQVVEDLEPSRGLAYSTVSTTLDRLYKKGILARDEEIGRGGSRWVYLIGSEEKLKGQMVKGAVDRLLTAFGPAVISTLNNYVDNIPEDELKRLEEKVRRGSRQR